MSIPCVVCMFSSLAQIGFVIYVAHPSFSSSMPPPRSERTWQVVCFPKCFDEDGEPGYAVWTSCEFASKAAANRSRCNTIRLLKALKMYQFISTHYDITVEANFAEL